MSDKPWNELTKEDIGLRPLREDEKQMRRPDWRGVEGKEDAPTVERRCSQMIHSGRATYHCGGRAKWAQDEGRYGHKQFFCSQHAGGALRSAKSDARKQAERHAKESAEGQARKRLEAVARELGLDDVDLDYRWSSGAYSTTQAVVRIEDLERLAEQLADSVPMEQC